MRHFAYTLGALALLSAGCSDDHDQGTLPQGSGGSGNGRDNGNGDGNGSGSDEQPTVSDPMLSVRTVVSGLTQPIGMAFLAENDFLVTEKPTGMVKHVVDGDVTATVLDLPVNSASERGLLGIALHPHFASNGWVYLYWTESSTGQDSDKVDEVGNPDSAFVPSTRQPLGNRVDRFVWDAQTQALTFDRNLLVLRAFQADADQPARGNNNGGVLRFAGTPKAGERAKLFVIIGDNGRRGLLQNLEQGPLADGSADDQFGGPEPDDEHLTGVVLRLNDDGSTPKDNPFFDAGAELGGETGSNVRRVFAYGIRNSFGLAVDPHSGELWGSENGDDAFDEINRIEPGHNGGWVQAMGPLSRLDEWKTIEFETEPVGLQQVRWPPSKIAKSPGQARARMVNLLGSHYGDPQFSWKYAVAPAAIGFLADDSLGAVYRGSLFVGAATPAPVGGYLFRLPLTPNRRGIARSDPVLADLVADNKEKFGIDESESLEFGQGFGISTDIQTGPKGNLFVVSTSNGAVYEIFRSSDQVAVGGGGVGTCSGA